MLDSNKKENRVQDQLSTMAMDDYKPSDQEEYMNEQQLEYFRQKLLAWKSELLKDSIETLHLLQEETHNEPDFADRAATETDRAIELRARDRERKLINKIEEAILRIDDKSYGYCEKTDDPIGLLRLEARLIATLCLECQERHERDEKTHRDD